MTSPSSPESRLAMLEAKLDALSMEVAALRAEVRDRAAQPRGAPWARPGATKGASTGSSERRTSSALRSGDVERLLGRYGMLAIAVLLAVAAVGTFLSWAISRGLLVIGPAVRVSAGLVLAIAIGVWGLRLRRAERSFGSSMLGLALVIVQVCAYAAGPSFALVPTWLAFGATSLVSWVLALFAHQENDEPLWCVAFGGAAVAPFVTSNGHGSVYALTAYAAASLLTACFAISHRHWSVAWRVFYAAAGLFALSTAGLSRRGGTMGFLAALSLPFVVAVAGIVPFAAESRKRGALRWLAMLAALTTLAAPGSTRPGAIVTGTACGLAAVLWLVILDRHAGVPQSSLLADATDMSPLLDWVDAAAIPLVLATQAIGSAGASVNSAAVHLAMAFPLAVFAWRRPVGPLRDASAFACAVLAAGVIAALPLQVPTGRVVAYLVLGVAMLRLHQLRPSRSWLVAGTVALFGAVWLSVAALTGRTVYVPSPFVTEPSAAAAFVALTLVVVARGWRWLRTATRTSLGDRPEWRYARSLRALVRVATLSPWMWVFLWALVELAMAFSASASTLLLVVYFAATAVACVAAGRARRAARLRQCGLGLALVAAATAFYGANVYFDFGARITAYLVTSAFLLGIAYWYRRPGSEPATA